MKSKKFFGIFFLPLFTLISMARADVVQEVDLSMCTLNNIQNMAKNYGAEIGIGLLGAGVSSGGVYTWLRSQNYVDTLKTAKLQLSDLQKVFNGTSWNEVTSRQVASRLLAESKMQDAKFFYGLYNLLRDSAYKGTPMTIPAQALGFEIFEKIPEISSKIEYLKNLHQLQISIGANVDELNVYMQSHLRTFRLFSKTLEKKFNEVYPTSSYPNIIEKKIQLMTEFYNNLNNNKVGLNVEMNKIYTLTNKNIKKLQTLLADRSQAFYKNQYVLDEWVANPANKNVIENAISRSFDKKTFNEIKSENRALFRIGKNIQLDEGQAAKLAKRWKIGGGALAVLGAITIVSVVIYDYTQEESSAELTSQDSSSWSLPEIRSDLEINKRARENLLSFTHMTDCAKRNQLRI